MNIAIFRSESTDKGRRTKKRLEVVIVPPRVNTRKKCQKYLNPDGTEGIKVVGFVRVPKREVPFLNALIQVSTACSLNGSFEYQLFDDELTVILEMVIAEVAGALGSAGKGRSQG